MNPQAMKPFGMALRAYLQGDAAAEVELERDDGLRVPIPVRHFFREPSTFSPIDEAAVGHCAGRVLDVGAGTGLHSLVLQEKGLQVTAIDVSSDAVEVMKQRGVKDAHCADIFNFQDGPFDTLLLMGHGIGMVETIAGLNRYLRCVGTLLTANGQILLDSLDVRKTDDPANLAYHEGNRKAGRYIGEIRLRCAFRGEPGPVYGWLQVDPDTLKTHAEQAGWNCNVILDDEFGNHLSRLTRCTD